MIQDFQLAKTLYRAIAKKYNHKNENDWLKFTRSKDFEQFKNILPKKPWIYYSKKNVLKRRKRMDKTKFNQKIQEGKIIIGGLGNPQGVRITKVTKNKVWYQ